jgi:hypothetical protein
MTKRLASFLAVAGILVGALMLGYRLLGAAAGPDPQLVAMVRQSEFQKLELPIPGAGASLVSRVHRFDRLSVHLDGAASAYVVGTLDFVGSIQGTEVSSVGLEKVPFAYRNGQWQPTAGWAPQLTAVVSALEERRRALEHNGNGFRPIGWYIRIERNQAIVTEEFHPRAEPSPRFAGEDAHSRRLTLQRRGDDFSFSQGLL